MSLEKGYFGISYDRKRTSTLTLDSSVGADDLTDNRLYNEEETAKFIYRDTVSGNDANSGLTEGLPKLTQSAAEALVDGSTYTTVQIIDDGAVIEENITKPTQMKRGVKGTIQTDIADMLGVFTQAGTPSFGIDDIKCQAWSNKLSLFVAGGRNGKIAYSTDGDTWVQSGTIPLGTSEARGIVWDEVNEIFVIVAAHGKICYSDDGDTWVLSSVSPFNPSLNINSVTRSKALGIYVAVGDSNQIAFSTDGDTWTMSSIRTFNTGNIYGVSYSEDLLLFVAVGQVTNITKSMAYSTDGDIWISMDGTESDTSIATGSALAGIIWSKDKGLFVAVGTFFFVGRIFYSIDGKSWTLAGTPSFGSDSIVFVSYSEDLGYFLAGGSTGKIAYSIDANVWIQAGTPSFGTSVMTCAAWSSKLGIFSVGSLAGKLAYSTVATTTISADVAGFTLNGVLYSGPINLKSCTIDSIYNTNDISFLQCRGINIESTSNAFSIGKNLFTGDVTVNCTVANQNDIDIYLNTIGGKLTINNASQTLYERIRENIIEGGIEATYNVVVTGGNVRGTVTNIIEDNYVSHSDPRFVDTTDYKLQFQSNGYATNSLAVGRSRYYLNSNGDARDIGCWSYLETDVTYVYDKSAYLEKGLITHEKVMTTSEQQGDSGEVSVYNNTSRIKEVLTIQYNTVDWSKISSVIDYIETLTDMSVLIQMDVDFEQNAGTVTVDGIHSIDDIVLNIASTATFNGMTLNIGGELYYVRQSLPNLTATTRLVLDRPLAVGLADLDVLNRNYPEGFGTYQYSPKTTRVLKRIDPNTLRNFRDGLTLRFVRGWQ